MRRIVSTLPVFFFFLLANSCMTTINITSVMERSDEGDYLLKWEVNPDQEGNITIYSAHDGSSIENFTPFAIAQITDHVHRINPSETGTRNFFFLRTANAFSGIVSNRFIEMQNIRNFRDVGGYFTTDNRQVRWGQIFRSGDLSSASEQDKQTINQLGIRTVLDFRSEENARLHPLQLGPDIQVIPLHLTPMEDTQFIELIERDALTRADAIRHMQEKYVEIVNNHKTEFSVMFDILADESNFPVLLTDALGKDGVGLAIFFILHVLGVPESVSVNDYMLSRQHLRERVSLLVQHNYYLSESMQEAVTAILLVDRAYLNYAVMHIRDEYGSVGNFIETQLGVSNRQRNALRRNLLYLF